MLRERTRPLRPERRQRARVGVRWMDADDGVTSRIDAPRHHVWISPERTRSRRLTGAAASQVIVALSFALRSGYICKLSSKATEAFHESRHPPRVRYRDREMRLRQHVPDALHDRGDPYRHLQRLSPSLHREAEARRHRWPR